MIHSKPSVTSVNQRCVFQSSYLIEWVSRIIRLCCAYRMRMTPRAAPRAVLVSGVARLVAVQRTVQKNGNVKSEPKYLACEESPIRAFYFWTLSCSSVALLASPVGWLLYFFVSESPAVSCVQHSFMHLAPQICTVQKASCAALPIPHTQRTSSRRYRVMHISGIQVCTRARFGRKKHINFIPDLVSFSSWFPRIYSYRFYQI